MQAVIDIGTNTFNVTIGNIKQNMLHVAYSAEIPVGLGKGGIHKGLITTDAIERALAAFKQINDYLNTYNVTKVIALATAALRNASNANDLILQVARQFNIPIQVIDGKTEATYIFYGAVHSFSVPDENILVMDIGGGSVEFIAGKNKKIAALYSFNSGLLKLQEMFNFSDPITPEDLNILNNYFAEVFKPLEAYLKNNPVKTLIGTAGSFNSIADVLTMHMHASPNKIDNLASVIHNNLFDQFYRLITTLAKHHREKLNGLVHFRVDTIPIAAVLINFIKTNFNIEKIITTPYALKEGVFFTDLSNK